MDDDDDDDDENEADFPDDSTDNNTPDSDTFVTDSVEDEQQSSQCDHGDLSSGSSDDVFDDAWTTTS